MRQDSKGAARERGERKPARWQIRQFAQYLARAQKRLLELEILLRETRVVLGKAAKAIALSNARSAWQ